MKYKIYIFYQSSIFKDEFITLVPIIVATESTCPVPEAVRQLNPDIVLVVVNNDHEVGGEDLQNRGSGDIKHAENNLEIILFFINLI